MGGKSVPKSAWEALWPWRFAIFGLALDHGYMGAVFAATRFGLFGFESTTGLVFGFGSMFRFDFTSATLAGHLTRPLARGSIVTCSASMILLHKAQMLAG
jgi:hypothetical protein